MSRVSIILPVYNGEKYLSKSIESIINQTYQDWELIIVNDCSSDKSPEIAERYEKEDSRIRVIHNTDNCKLPKSLNIGFSSARGDYLTWTSDDNMYLPTAIEKMVRVLETGNDSYMVRTDMSYIDAEGNIIGESEEYTDEKMYLSNCLGACFMYKRSVLDAVGEYDENTFCVEDYDYWLRILDEYHHIDSIKEILYMYRRHNESLSETKRVQVEHQLAKLREKYIKKIFSLYKESKNELCRIYLEMCTANHMPEKIQTEFEQFLPELKGKVEISQNENIAIFGAGVYGKNAAKQFAPFVECFVDNDITKQGTIVQGIPVKSLTEYIEKNGQALIVIAVAPKRVYSMIKQLYENGITRYGVFSDLRMEVSNV